MWCLILIHSVSHGKVVHTTHWLHYTLHINLASHSWIWSWRTPTWNTSLDFLPKAFSCWLVPSCTALSRWEKRGHTVSLQCWMWLWSEKGASESKKCLARSVFSYTGFWWAVSRDNNRVRFISTWELNAICVGCQEVNIISAADEHLSLLFNSPRETQASSRHSVPFTEEWLSWATSAAPSPGLLCRRSNTHILDAVNSTWKSYENTEWLQKQQYNSICVDLWNIVSHQWSNWWCNGVIN